MNNGQILYLYDAKMCNPNGDPDEENRPRMDYERDLNLVSDLRLKRYIRDYCLLQNMGLYVQKIDDKPVTSEDRLADFWKDEKHLDFDKILDAFIDIRMFGATVTAKTTINPSQAPSNLIGAIPSTRSPSRKAASPPILLPSRGTSREP